MREQPGRHRRGWHPAPLNDIRHGWKEPHETA
jgi:hypothetical protein